MKMTKMVTAAMILGTFSLSAGWLIGGTLPARGPIPFASWDADGSGTIEEQRSKHHDAHWIWTLR
jgi:hypothetical protein